MKKFISNLLVLITASAVLLSAFSCGGKREPSADPEETAKQTLSVTETQTLTEEATETETETETEAETEYKYPPTSEEFLTSSYDEETDTVTLYVNTKTEYPENIVLPDKFDGKTVSGFSVDLIVRNVKTDLPESEWYYDQYGYLIKEKVEMVTSFATPENIKSLYLPKSVDRLNFYGFDNCERLEEIVFADTEGWVIYQYESVDDVDMYTKYLDVDPSEIADPASAAAYVKELENKDISFTWSKKDIATTPVSPDDPPTKAYYLTELDDGTYEIDTKNALFTEVVELPSSYNGKKITSIGENAFKGKKGIKRIIVPKGYTNIMSSAFEDCSDLTEIVLPESLEFISYSAFSGCSSLTSLDIPDSVTSIGERAFENCSSLASLDIPDSVTSIGERAFENCSSLASLKIPANLTSIDSSIFTGCTGLISVIIPDGVTSISSGVFNDCEKLESITVSSGNGVYSGKGNCIIEKNTGTVIAGCKGSVIPGDGSATAIGDEAFAGCTGLTSVTIPESVTSIGDYAFNKCSNLVSITIPESVTAIGNGAFERCVCLTTVTISEGVTSIGHEAFAGCIRLSSITIPDSATVIGQFAFSGCDSLTDIKLPNSLTLINVATFSGCENLTNITIPESVTYISWDTFSGCDNLEFNAYGNALYLGNDRNPYKALIQPTDVNITQVKIHPDTEIIAVRAFASCSNLTSVSVPSKPITIGALAFQGCDNIQYTAYNSARYLGNEDNPYAALVEIYDNGLSSIVIHKDTKSIITGTFISRDKLKAVFYEGTEEQWSKINGNDVPDTVEIIFKYKD